MNTIPGCQSTSSVTTHPPHMCYKAVNTVTFSFKDGPRSNHDAEGGANGGK
ncbi:hypothetical protein HMPREF9589_00065 [Cutibacterium acnes HL059PA1]|nr:hypothetical protein HMPREF9589_00065 [Cutibacterium acnes HL059PA1]EFT72018.1 hypothetical protein HMPREF9590_01802 [Cutibacterium acnes HL059PA2]